MGMSSRRPAAPRRPYEPDAQRPPVRWHGGLPLASLPSAWLPLVLSMALVAVPAPHPAEAATPLPPVKPKDLKASPAATATRPPLLRSAPLPPRRPPELAEEDGEAEPEAGSQETAQERPVDPGTADGFVREPARPSPPPRMASRETTPDAAPSPGLLPAAPPFVAPAGPVEMPTACAELVAAGEIEASLDASLSPNPACGTFVPVRLTAVRLADGRMIPLRPAAISRCELTVAAATWMREALAPAVAAAGGALVAIRIADSYNCRPRNRVAGAKMSEHGRGNAVDVGGFELGDGRVWTVAKGGLPMSLRASMKDSACTRFSTVLGPGSDGYHEDHIHVDLAQRRNDFKLCHWNLDAGSAVASRKEKPAGGGATTVPPEGKGGEDAADQEAAAGSAEAEPEAGPVSVPPATGNAAGKSGQPKDGQPKNGGPKIGQAKDQPRSTPPVPSAAKPTSPKPTSPKAGSSTTASSKDSAKDGSKDASAKGSKPATVQPN